MATVIDALLVELGIDNSKFKKGSNESQKDLEKVRKEGEKTAKHMQEMGKKTADFYKEVTKGVLVFFAVLTAGRGLVEFTRETITSNAELARLALNLETSASTLSAWKRSVEVSGGSGNAFLGTIQNLSRSLTELKLTGQTGILPYLRALGIGVADASGKARPLDNIMLDLSDKFSRMESRQDAYNIAKMMGIDEGTVNLLLKGRKAVQEMLDAQKKQAAVTEASAAASEKLREGWTKMKLRLDAVMAKLLEKAIPALEKLVQMLDRLVQWCEENPKIVATVLTGITAMVIALGVAAVAAMVPLLALASPFIVIAAKIALATAAVMALMTALKSLFESETFKKWAKSDHARAMTHNTNATDGGESVGIDPASYGSKPSASKKSGSTSRATGNTSGTVAEREAIIRDKLMKDGYTSAQASGIIGSLKQENGKLDPSVVNGIGMTGIAQWDTKRRAKFKQLFGKDIGGASLEEQTDFMIWEMKNTEKRAGNAIRNSSNPGQAATLHSDLYERAGAHEKNNARRVNMANDHYRRSSSPQYSANASDRAGGNTSGDTNKSVTIGQVVVNTQATDSKGISRDIASDLRANFNTGMA